METDTSKYETSGASWESYLDRLIVFSGYLSALVIFLLMILVTAGVFFRRVVEQPLIFGEEYSAYMMVFCVYLGGAYTLQQDAHIRVDVVTIRLKDRLRTILRAITSCLSIIYGAVLTWKTVELVIYYKQIGHQALSILETSTWIPATVVPVGLAILTIAMVLCAVRDVRQCFKRPLADESKPM